VVGVEVDQKLINDVFLNATSVGNAGHEVLCDRPDELSCFLIDQGSLIVASNQIDVKVKLTAFSQSSNFWVGFSIVAISSRFSYVSYENKCLHCCVAKF